MEHRRLALVSAVLVATAGLGGCAGSDGPTADPTGESPTSGATSTDAAPGDPSSGDPGETTSPSRDYLPVPAGVSLTPPGTGLVLKDSATAAWTPRQGLVGVVDVAVTRLEETTVEESLGGFELSDEQAASTPYFVRAKVTNVGDTDLGARQLPLYVLDSTGSLVPPTGVDRGFEACPGSTLPAIFAPGDSATTCLVFLVPEGGTLDAVTFRPPEGVVPLTWTGDAKPPRGDRGGKGDQGDQGGGGGQGGGGLPDGGTPTDPGDQPTIS